MDKKIAHLPNTELEIMMVLWEAGKPVPRAYIDEQLKGRQNWASTTVLNFLSRLADKGFVLSEQQGRARVNLYSALISRDEYLAQESRSVLGRLCGASVNDLILHLYDSRNIDDNDLDELQSYITKLRREKK
ncbi:MAG: BlaI/MecI/CopY family transcriptional regulator [Oscillospiraceae bacterium]|nr:BlaI/MecI/CopY family transcriptional regulator [Oscillospiraceae bacterium]